MKGTSPDIKERQITMEYTCSRCSKTITEKNHIIQDIVYLGKSKPRQLLCDKCYESFILWFNNPEGKEE